MANNYFNNYSSSRESKGTHRFKIPFLSLSRDFSRFNHTNLFDKQEESVPSADEGWKNTAKSLLTWHVQITPSSLITFSIFQIVLLCFVFMSGIFLGSGSITLPQAIELEKIFATKEGVETDDLSSNAEILARENLRFMQSLQKETPQPILTNPEKKDTEHNQQIQQPLVTQPKEEKKVEETKEPQFDFLIRVAAFKNAAQADSLKDKLTKNGIKVRRTSAKGKKITWQYVQTTLRGTQENYNELISKLSSLGIRDCMLLEQKAVPTKSSKTTQVQTKKKK